jgi:hypothetical protein
MDIPLDNELNLQKVHHIAPRSRLRMAMTSFIPSTVSLWNNLDLNIRNSPNISCIKYRIIKENTIKRESLLANCVSPETMLADSN